MTLRACCPFFEDSAERGREGISPDGGPSVDVVSLSHSGCGPERVASRGKNSSMCDMTIPRDVGPCVILMGKRSSVIEVIFTSGRRARDLNNCCSSVDVDSEEVILA